MTKEPKLQAAMRIVPEWKDYDTEVKNLMDTWRSSVNKTKTSQKTDEKDEL